MIQAGAFIESVLSQLLQIRLASNAYNFFTQGRNDLILSPFPSSFRPLQGDVKKSRI